MVITIIVVLVVLYFIVKSGKGAHVASSAATVGRNAAKFATTTIGATVMGVKKVAEETGNFRSRVDLAGLLRELEEGKWKAVRILFKDGNIGHIRYKDKYKLDGMPIAKEQILKNSAKYDYFVGVE